MGEEIMKRMEWRNLVFRGKGRDRVGYVWSCSWVKMWIGGNFFASLWDGMKVSP